MEFISVQEQIGDTNLVLDHIIKENDKVYAEISLNSNNTLELEKHNDSFIVFHQRNYMRDLTKKALSQSEQTINKMEYALFKVDIISNEVNAFNLHIEDVLENYFLHNSYGMLKGSTFNLESKVLRVPLLEIPF